MNKKQLLVMPKIKVTPSMYRLAMEDKPKITVHNNYYGRKYETREHNTAVYLRCCIKDGILKIACFITEDIRTGSKKPKYEIYSVKLKIRILLTIPKTVIGLQAPSGV